MAGDAGNDEAAWRDLIARFAAAPADGAGPAPWPAREDLTVSPPPATPGDPVMGPLTRPGTAWVPDPAGDPGPLFRPGMVPEPGEADSPGWPAGAGPDGRSAPEAGPVPGEGQGPDEGPALDAGTALDEGPAPGSGPPPGFRPAADSRLAPDSCLAREPGQAQDPGPDPGGAPGPETGPGPGRPWPGQAGLGRLRARIVRPAASAAPPGETGEDHYVPPPPAPLPSLDPVTKGAWVALFGGPGYLLLAVMMGWAVPGWAAFSAVAAFVAGFATLVVRMGDEPPRGSGPDNGAVV